jgi:hypothetical protein
MRNTPLVQAYRGSTGSSRGRPRPRRTAHGGQQPGQQVPHRDGWGETLTAAHGPAPPCAPLAVPTCCKTRGALHSPSSLQENLDFYLQMCVGRALEAELASLPREGPASIARVDEDELGFRILKAFHEARELRFLCTCVCVRTAASPCCIFLLWLLEGPAVTAAPAVPVVLPRVCVQAVGTVLGRAGSLPQGPLVITVRTCPSQWGAPLSSVRIGLRVDARQASLGVACAVCGGWLGGWVGLLAACVGLAPAKHPLLPLPPPSFRPVSEFRAPCPAPTLSTASGHWTLQTLGLARAAHSSGHPGRVHYYVWWEGRCAHDPSTTTPPLQHYRHGAEQLGVGSGCYRTHSGAAGRRAISTRTGTGRPRSSRSVCLRCCRRDGARREMESYSEVLQHGEQGAAHGESHALSETEERRQSPPPPSPPTHPPTH